MTVTEERGLGEATWHWTPSYFSYGYLDKGIRQKVIDHVEQGKTFRCHHRDCRFYIDDIEFSTLYDYNMHCYRNHPKQPLHPSMQYIIDVNTKKFLTDKPWQIPKLEARGNPWE